MDNVTHSLVGLAVGEAAVQLSGGDSSRRKRFWWMSALANNVPDLDVLIRAGHGHKLDYLLQHRGFTHTFVCVLPQALLLWAVFWLLGRRNWRPGDERWLLGLAIFGVASHIGFDWLNSYGVHPFWPLTGQWFYGDTLFIVEPWLWLALLPVLIRGAWSAGGRALFVGLLLFAIGLLWGAPYVPKGIALALTLFSVGWAATQWRLPVGRRAYTGLVMGLAVVALFRLVSFSASRTVRAATALAEPDVLVDDVILTPMPANPFCWNVIVAARRNDTYLLQRGTFAPWSALFAPEHCPHFHGGGTVARLAPVAGKWDARFRWEGEAAGPLAELRELRASDCAAMALLHFARAPYLRRDDGDRILGDLRFDFGRDLGFAAYRLPASAICPKLPPWGEPRADWLE